jgi:hypothetical protein
MAHHQLMSLCHVSVSLRMTAEETAWCPWQGSAGASRSTPFSWERRELDNPCLAQAIYQDP